MKMDARLLAVLLLAAIASSDAACPCPMDYSPVCGSDGKTYGNQCALECERDTNNAELKSQCEGLCPCSPEVCICQLDNNPVCGSDGTTYPNECSLKCKARTDNSLTKISDGPCPA